MPNFYSQKKRTGCQLCYPYEDARLEGSSRKAWNAWPVGTQPKLDGERCRYVNGLLLSSTEELIYSVPHIQAELKRLKFPFEPDGELYVHGMAFESIHSIVSRTVNLHPDHEQMQFHVFDIASDNPNESQMVRSAKLKTFFRDYINPDGPIKLVSLKIASTKPEVMQNYEDYLELGYEGMVVRHLSAPYVRRRSTFVMKFKPKKHDTFLVTNYTEEHDLNGNPKNRLGTLTCVSVEGNGDTFDVYSGFDDYLRDVLWACRETLVGRKLTVYYQNLTAAKGVPHFGRVDANELKTTWRIEK